MYSSNSSESEENDWEFLAKEELVDHGGDADEVPCCPGGLGIDPQYLINTNYFAYPSENLVEEVSVFADFYPKSPRTFSAVEYLVNDESRFRNSPDLNLSEFSRPPSPPSCSCAEESDAEEDCESLETKGDDATPRIMDMMVAKTGGLVTAAGDPMGLDVTERLRICPVLLRVDSSSCIGSGDRRDGIMRALWREGKDPIDDEHESKLQIGEVQGSKLVEDLDLDVFKFHRLEKSKAMERKCMKEWWKHPLGIWKRQIGTLCSFGVAAAFMGLLILGRGWYRGKHQDRKLRFHVYADDRRISEMICQAARLNQAFSAVRGVPVVRAQISFGGYYDAL
eukprot:Gb_12741 [translate_table: standard]